MELYFFLSLKQLNTSYLFSPIFKVQFFASISNVVILKKNKFSTCYEKAINQINHFQTVFKVLYKATEHFLEHATKITPITIT